MKHKAPPPPRANTADAALYDAAVRGKGDVTFDAVHRIYKATGKWPRVDKVQRRIFVRGLARGFVSLSSDEKESIRRNADKLLGITIAKQVFLITYDANRNLVDIWGTNQATVSAAMLAVLRLLRKP